MATVFIGIGANLGDRRANMACAVRLLGDSIRAASLYETTPVGGPLGQPDFLNSVLQMETTQEPMAVFAQLQGVEAALARMRQERDGPRTIDLDLLLFDRECIETADLIIPHPRFHQRGFVLMPLSELAGEVVHPVLQQSIRVLCEQWANSGTMERVVRVCGPEWIESSDAVDFSSAGR
jgi:2-amino-4-hydroxy-6-hydroxymethyldihydropteridine diphosphokinase